MNTSPPLRTRGRCRSPQRGATLIIGLIMIVLISLIVINAFTLSSSNFKSVVNMQIRDEASAAANQAVEQVIGSDFTSTPWPRSSPSMSTRTTRQTIPLRLPYPPAFAPRRPQRRHQATSNWVPPCLQGPPGIPTGIWTRR